MGAIQISGALIASDSCGGCGSGVGGDQATFYIGDRCGCTLHFESVISTQQPLQVLTSGLPGAEFVDLDVLDGFTRIELLALRTSAKLVLRIGAAEARVVGVGGTFPTGFGGGETLQVDFDGLGTITVAFDAADQTAAQCAARINAAAALAGLPTPRATVATSGQLALEGVETGVDGSVQIIGGSGLATLGFSTGTTAGAGADIPIDGESILRFPRDTSAPARVQVSGQGTISLMAGGRTSA